jgi:hypothetical protein
MTTVMNRRSALRAIGALSATAGATAAFAFGVSEATAVPASPPARPAAAIPKLLQLEAAFKAEWTKHRAQLPEHDAAERAQIDARPPRPESTPLPDDLVEALRDMSLRQIGNDSHPVNIAQRAHYARDAARLAAYNEECAAIDKRIGWEKINCAYVRQLDRVSRAADRVIAFPARSVADLGVKMRVIAVWDLYGDDDFQAIVADINRIVRSERKAVLS